MASQQPKVSIIIPAYNHAAWITQALNSVFAQSLSDWELIIIDDASADETWAVIEKAIATQHTTLHSQITSIRHTHNQGAPATLNEGLSLARGEFVAILNSDDVWTTNRLDRLYQYATKNALDFVATGLFLWDKNSRMKNASEADWLSWYQGLYADAQKHGDFLRTLLRGNFLITTSNFFLRSVVYEQLGGFSGLRYVHDYEYVLRMAKARLRMECLWNERLLYYRLHDSNTIREQPLAAIRENMGLLLRLLPGLSQQLNASRLHGLQRQLQDLYRYTHEEWRTNMHYRLIGKEQELFPLITDRDRWVTERDAIISDQVARLTEQQCWIRERDTWIAERDAIIVQMQADIEQQQVWIAERESWLGDRDKMISKRDQWVMERDTWITEREQWIQERDQMIAALQAEHQSLLSSWSYRLGSLLLNPLRLWREWLAVRKVRQSHA